MKTAGLFVAVRYTEAVQCFRSFSRCPIRGQVAEQHLAEAHPTGRRRWRQSWGWLGWLGWLGWSRVRFDIFWHILTYILFPKSVLALGLDLFHIGAGMATMQTAENSSSSSFAADASESPGAQGGHHRTMGNFAVDIVRWKSPWKLFHGNLKVQANYIYIWYMIYIFIILTMKVV